MEEAFKEIINHIKPTLKKAGFKKKGLNFYKNENELIYIINIQKSHGNSFNEISFYINCAIHSNIIAKELNREIIEFPKEYQCYYSKRIEKISSSAPNKFTVNISICIDELKDQLKKSLEDVIRHFQQIDNTTLFIQHMCEKGTLAYKEIFKFCLKKNLTREAKKLVQLFKNNFEHERWESVFKKRFKEILEEENTTIEIRSFTMIILNGLKRS